MPTEEEQAKILLDAEVGQEANKNIGLVMRGELSTAQVNKLAEIDREYLRATRACVTEGAEPDSPANA